MLRHSRAVLPLVAIVVLATACGGDDPAPPADTPAATTSSPPAAPAPVKEPAWALKVGDASFSGPVVMPANMGKFSSYGLATSGFSATVMLLKEHASDPHSVQLSFMETSEMCIYRSDNKNVSGGVTVEKKGDRYMVSGDIGCGPVKGDTKEARTVSGYFKAKPL